MLAGTLAGGDIGPITHYSGMEAAGVRERNLAVHFKLNIQHYPAIPLRYVLHSDSQPSSQKGDIYCWWCWEAGASLTRCLPLRERHSKVVGAAGFHTAAGGLGLEAACNLQHGVIFKTRHWVRKARKRMWLIPQCPLRKLKMCVYKPSTHNL